MVTKKMCDTNKNVIKMGVIIKGVYCIWIFYTYTHNIGFDIGCELYLMVATFKD
jgi:hypothetical protein